MIKKSNKNISLISILFSTFVALIPILEYYSSPFSIFSMAMLLIIVFLVIFTFRRDTKIRINKSLLLLLIYLIFSIFISCTVQRVPVDKKSILSFGRTLLWIVTVFVLGNNYFNKDIAFKSLKTILCLSTCMIFIQTIFYNIWGVQIHSTFQFLYREQGYFNRAVYSFYRPSGLFMEPSHFAMSAILYLTYALFKEHEPSYIVSSIDWRTVILISSGVIMSTSGMGYLFLAITFIMWYFVNFIVKITPKKILTGMVIVLTGICLLLIITKTSVFQNAIGRVFDGDKVGGTALDGRVATSVYFTSLPKKIKWVGTGYGRGEAILYMSSFYRYLYECGYVSIPILGIVLLSALSNKSRYVKYFVFIYAIMTYFASTFAISTMCFVFAFLFAKNNIKEKKCQS